MAFGRTELFLVATTGISVIAALTDVAWGRIYNWLTLPMLLAAFVAAGWFGGWLGLGNSALGAAVGLMLYGWMFALGMMGGGDVKLLMVLGAWGGFHYAEEVALLGMILGGAMAVLLLLFKGRLLGFARRMARFLLTVFVKELELEAPQIDRSLTMPFGIPIGAAAVWSAWAHPLVGWGFRPWP